MKGLYLEHPTKGDILISEEPLTVLEVHRQLQIWADDYASDNTIDITDENPSQRINDVMIMINPPYKLVGDFNLMTEGLIYSGGDVHYFKISKEKLINDFKAQCRIIEEKINEEKLWWQEKVEKIKKNSWFPW